MRLGFVVKPLARPELRSHDSRRWQNSPHLSVSLAYLRDVFTYLAEAKISMYRMSSELAPYATHPDMPQFHRQVEQCAAELAQLGAIARSLDLRLSFHPAQHVILNAPGPDLVARSAADLAVQAAILDAMSMGPEAVVVTHLGGVYGDREAARDRFVRNYEALPEAARRRLALENDDVRFGVADTLWVHERTGIRLVFDNLHHRLNNPDGRPSRDALSRLPGDLAQPMCGPRSISAARAPNGWWARWWGDPRGSRRTDARPDPTGASDPLELPFGLCQSIRIHRLPAEWPKACARST